MAKGGSITNFIGDFIMIEIGHDGVTGKGIFYKLKRSLKLQVLMKLSVFLGKTVKRLAHAAKARNKFGAVCHHPKKSTHIFNSRRQRGIFDDCDFCWVGRYTITCENHTKKFNFVLIQKTFVFV